MKTILFIFLFPFACFGQQTFIHLTRYDIAGLTPVVIQYDSLMNERHIAIAPVMLKDSTYILPTAMLCDPAYTEILHAIYGRGLRLNVDTISQGRFFPPFNPFNK